MIRDPVHLTRRWLFDEPQTQKVPIGSDFRGAHPAILKLTVQVIPHMSFDAVEDLAAILGVAGSLERDSRLQDTPLRCRMRILEDRGPPWTESGQHAQEKYR